MPYAGGTYSLPPGTAATTLTAIDSSDYNAFIADIEAAQNAARPIVAGGTGATSAITAWDALAKKGTDIASAASINLTTATGPSITITGTVAITGVTLAEGSIRLVRAAAALPLTASVNLLVNGSSTVSLTCTAEDLLVFRGGAAGVVTVSRIGNSAAADLGTTIHALTAKATPVDADELGGSDSAASNVGKKTTYLQAWTNYFKAKADALYQPLKTILTTLGNLANGSGALINDGSGVLSWGASGGMTLLATVTPTAFAVTVPITGIAAGYTQLYFEMDGVGFNTVGAHTLNAAISSTNGGAYGASVVASYSLSTDEIFDCVGWIYLAASTTKSALLQTLTTPNSGGATTQKLAAILTDTSAVLNAIKFLADTASYTWKNQGVIRVYGVK